MSSKPSAMSPPAPINWNDPELASLLLGNPLQCPPAQRTGQDGHAVEVFVGWSGTAGRPGRLVWERDPSLVLATSFALLPGEQVRLDSLVDHRARQVWAMVAESRSGLRKQDQGLGMHLHWLRIIQAH